MPNQRHSGTGDNVTGDQTRIERQITQGSGSTYIEHAAPEQIFPKELTARIPKTAPDKIVGREAKLGDLHRRLFDNKQVVLVNGMGVALARPPWHRSIPPNTGMNTVTSPGSARFLRT